MSGRGGERERRSRGSPDLKVGLVGRVGEKGRRGGSGRGRDGAKGI